MKARLALKSVIKENSDHLWKIAQQSARDHPQWHDIRRIATDLLISHGAQEVGTSDVNHAVYAIYRQYSGDWNAALVDMGYDRPEPGELPQSEIDRLTADKAGMGEL